MRSWIAVGCFIIYACSNETNVEPISGTPDSTNTMAAQTASTDTSASFAKNIDTLKALPLPIIKRPSGFYEFVLPDGEELILHTIAFYPGSFRLQEEYTGNEDSTVVIEGTWAPSEGYIWLYKDQLVRARYRWKGDTLQYYNPELKKSFSMTKLTPAGKNVAWQEKRKAGAVFYGIGTEPFWSIEVRKTDSLIFSSPEWQSPLKVKLSETIKGRDSSVYRSSADSVQLTVYPFFCNEGMSDFIYPSKVKFIYKGQTYQGCGVIF